MKFVTALFLVSIPFAAFAQSAVHDLRQVSIAGGRTPAETAVSVGRQLVGKPYVPHTLDTTPTEQLVVNLREFDCTTYIETVLALALTWHETTDRANQAFERTFQTYLTKLRYRDGKIDGYASRLHYFSDWLRDNERRGLLSDVTDEIPGSMVVAKPVSYMTTATHKYPPLSDPATLKQLRLTEAALSQQSFSFVPSKNIQLAESHLREGDIVMLTAARPGLDMRHVGFAVRQPDGRIHLMHASSDQGAVAITRYPLSNYLLYHKHLSGIRVARLRSGTVLTATARD